jgi:alpha-mannosidase
MPATRLTIHLVANAHLDPVWLWDWREGLNEGITTCRTMLDLMDEDPEFTFVRGEAAIYRHIREHDPATFARIAARVAEGRWDVVGGTWVQADTNLPATETFVRQYLHGQGYLAEAFGKPVRVAWAADSFGHAAGLPEVMAGAGITGFVFTRPEEKVMPLALPAFWWEGSGGSRILAYRPLAGWYGCERGEAGPKLDRLLEQADRQPLRDVGFFYGLGNHGGGATRRHLAEIRAWAERHPEVRVVHSGLHRLLDALADDVAARGLDLPVHRGEMNFCLRGCYASVAKFKWPYRRAEAALSAAETIDALAATATERRPADLAEEWRGICFGSFHDILPGSSIERAYDDQLAWLGGIVHRSQGVTLAAVNALAARIDTSVPRTGDHPTAVPHLLWNPHPHPVSGLVELEGSLDYRPIWAYKGRPDDLPIEVRDADGEILPHQAIATEHHAMVNLAWRKRVVVPVTLPPLGWRVVTMGWVEGAVRAARPGGVTASADAIANGIYEVRAAIGAAGLDIRRHGEPVFAGDGLQAVVVEDRWGSWGGMAEEPDSFDLRAVRARWTVAKVELRERGPERAALWVRLCGGGSSRIDLTITLARDRPAVDLAARVFWDERCARLHLLMPGATDATYEVPGGRATRTTAGEVPGLRWARVTGPGGGFGFASDALSSFAVRDGAFTATVVRASRYADDVTVGPEELPWMPAVDCGELSCRLLIAAGDERLPVLARELCQAPFAQTVVPARPVGPELPRSGSFAALRPESLAMLALKPAADGEGLVLRVQETTGRATGAELTLFGARLDLGGVGGGSIASWRLRGSAAGWSAERCDGLERPLPAGAPV